jgi:hypothetical protein
MQALKHAEFRSVCSSRESRINPGAQDLIGDVITSCHTCGEAVELSPFTCGTMCDGRDFTPLSGHPLDCWPNGSQNTSLKPQGVCQGCGHLIYMTRNLAERVVTQAQLWARRQEKARQLQDSPGICRSVEHLEEIAEVG